MPQPMGLREAVPVTRLKVDVASCGQCPAPPTAATIVPSMLERSHPIARSEARPLAMYADRGSFKVEMDDHLWFTQ